MAYLLGNRDTKCPYYDHEGKDAVYCEGLIKETKYSKNSFKSEAEKRKFQRECCFSYDYINCPHAKHLTEQYNKISRAG